MENILLKILKKLNKNKIKKKIKLIYKKNLFSLK